MSRASRTSAALRAFAGVVAARSMSAGSDTICAEAAAISLLLEMMLVLSTCAAPVAAAVEPELIMPKFIDPTPVGGARRARPRFRDLTRRQLDSDCRTASHANHKSQGAHGHNARAG